MKLAVSLLILLWSSVAHGGEVLHTVTGDVSRGQFTYYILMFEGPITLNLHSRSGDADLYISQHVSKPTYEPDSYCLQSVTCGVDTIRIPSSFKRPIGIGVYGHPSHDVSTYLLEATYSDEDDIDDDFFSKDRLSFEDIEEVAKRSDSYPTPRHSNEEDGVDLNDQEREEREISPVWALIWPVISILLEALV